MAKRRVDSLSATVGRLMEKAVQNEQILRRYQSYELLLLDADGFNQLLELLLEASLAYFQFDAVELWLFDPQDTLTELLDESKEFKTLHFLSSPLALNRLYKSKAVVKLASLLEMRELSIFIDQNMHSAALLPLFRHGVLIGSFHLGSRDHQRFSTDKSTDFINHLASVVAVCIENVVNQERLLRLSMYDMLTKVKNRRAFQLALDKEVSRAIRTSDPLSLLFIDLDHFKRINDEFGHQTGDLVLKVVAQCIQKMLRNTDHVCRYGGEEFALILPSCTEQRAKEVAERIRVQVGDLLMTNHEDKKISVTLSIGACCWLVASPSDSERVARNLVKYADEGVYQAKDRGRNMLSYVAYRE